MAVIQNNIADGFVYITDMIHHLGINGRKSDLQQLACLDFVKYLDCKSKHPEKIVDFHKQLLKEEQIILDILAKFVIDDKDIRMISKSVGKIQQIFINNLPPETKEFKFLKTMFPDLLKYRPN
jgi:hypothetical protein